MGCGHWEGARLSQVIHHNHMQNGMGATAPDHTMLGDQALMLAVINNALAVKRASMTL